jgi:hypothetical protein
MIKFKLILALAALVPVLALLSLIDGDALNHCQETHSFDTCFSSLNR